MGQLGFFDAQFTWGASIDRSLGMLRSQDAFLGSCVIKSSQSVLSS
jgi:hypothetical protein